jgi:N-acetylmuramoyl-L-alanine amidase
MRRLTCSLPVALLLAAPALSQTSRLTGVRFWSVGDVTRIAVETSSEVEYRYERIDSPDRLFLDLDGTLPQAGKRGMETIPVGDRLVKQIRVARTQPEVTRVVVDLASPVEYSVSQLTNPHRIIVELRAAKEMQAGPPVRSSTGGQGMEAQAAAAEPEPRPERPLRLPPERIAPARPLADPPRLAANARILEPRSVPVPRAPEPAPPSPLAAESKTQPAPAEPKAPPEKARAARSDSQGQRSLIRALGLKLSRVVLDPGHGGHDTGTIGPGGLEEKTLVLDIAKRLGALIAQRLGSEVIYTRTDDTFVPLETRTELANEQRADLFLSIHANSSRLARISGSETFYLNFTTSASDLEVAARENATSQKSIYELQSLLQKIALKEKIQESREFAAIVQKSLQNGLWRSRGVKDRGVKQAPFVVLIGAQMPSVLAEVAFLSNPRDEAQLKRPEYRQRVAEALFKGVSQYASALSHFEVAQGKGAEGK